MQTERGSVKEIVVVGTRCIGAGNCVEAADDYFDQSDDDATVVVIRSTVAEGDDERVQRAVNICPVAALVLEERGHAAS